MWVKVKDWGLDKVMEVEENLGKLTFFAVVPNLLIVSKNYFLYILFWNGGISNNDNELIYFSNLTSSGVRTSSDPDGTSYVPLTHLTAVSYM